MSLVGVTTEGHIDRCLWSGPLPEAMLMSVVHSATESHVWVHGTTPTEAMIYVNVCDLSKGHADVHGLLEPEVMLMSVDHPFTKGYDSILGPCSGRGLC